MNFGMSNDFVYILSPPPPPAYNNPNLTVNNYEEFALQMRENTIDAMRRELDIAVRQLQQKRREVDIEFMKLRNELNDFKQERQRLKYEAMGFEIKCRCLPDASDFAKLEEIQNAGKKKASKMEAARKRQEKRKKLFDARVKIRPTIQRQAAIVASKKLATMAGK